MVERKYYEINEELAKQSLGMWSFSTYTQNSTTKKYQQEVNQVYLIVDKIEQEKPSRLEEAKTLAEKYSKSYAEWINKSNHIEMMCPSVMICGAGNFPVRKKEKQNQAREKHFKDLEYINNYIKKIKNILNGKDTIKSGDADAIEKLQTKLEELEQLQQTMKNANSYYRKHNTLQGFTELKQINIDKIEELMKNNTYIRKPFESYSLTNNNAKIKATKQRIEQLQKAKEAGTKQTMQSDICKVVENTEIMRIQIVFEGKPDEQIRNILKSNGFRWSPKNLSWQRQLTENARYSAKRVLDQLQQLQTV